MKPLHKWEPLWLAILGVFVIGLCSLLYKFGDRLPGYTYVDNERFEIGYMSIMPEHYHIAAHLEKGPRVLVLHNSPGGRVRSGLGLLELFEEVHITGTQCRSMCVYMALLHHNVHLGPNITQFDFHSISSLSPVLNKWELSRERTQSFLKQLPPDLLPKLQPLLDEVQFIAISVTEVERARGAPFPRLD